jgi:O-antigen/teichoic acid export membrane protein
MSLEGRIRALVPGRVMAWLPADPLLRRARLQTWSTFALRGINLLARLVSIPLSLKLLGAEGYGIWLALGSLLAWMALVDFGAPAGLMHPLSTALAQNDRVRARQLISSTLLYLTVIALITVLVLAPLVWAGPLAGLLKVQHTPLAQVRSAALWALALSAISIPLRLASTVLLVQHRGYIAVWADIFAQVISLLGLVALALTGGGLTAFVLVMLVPGMVIGIIINLWLFGSEEPDLRPGLGDASFQAFKSVGGQGTWFFAAFISDAVVMQTDFLVISSYLGSAELPRYAVAYQLISFVFHLIFSWAKPLWPAYSDKAARGELQWIRAHHRKVLVQCVSAMATVAIFFALLGRPFIHFWAGEESTPPRALLWVMAGYFPLWMVCAINGMLINAVGMIKWRASISLAGAALNLILSLVLVRRMGVTGVAVGSLVGMGLTEALIYPFIIRRFFFGPKRAGFEVLAPSVDPQLESVAPPLSPE